MPRACEGCLADHPRAVGPCPPDGNRGASKIRAIRLCFERTIVAINRCSACIPSSMSIEGSDPWRAAGFYPSRRCASVAAANAGRSESGPRWAARKSARAAERARPKRCRAAGSSRTARSTCAALEAATGAGVGGGRVRPGRCVRLHLAGRAGADCDSEAPAK